MRSLRGVCLALLIAGLFCATAGLLAQSGRDAYRQAFDFWQQTQAGLERDAGTGGAPLLTLADRSAAAAANFEAARAAFAKSTATELAKRRKILDSPSVRSSADLLPPAVASLAGAELLTLNKAIARFAADKDPGIQQLRQSLERERVALVALTNSIETRKEAVTAALQADAPLEQARLKTAEAFGSEASQLMQNTARLEKEAAAWADYYTTLANAIQNANAPAPAAVPTPTPAGTPESTPVAMPPAAIISSTAAANVSAPAPRNDSISPVPLVRYVGEWTFPSVNGIFHGAAPISVELTVRESQGHVDGTLSGRFKPPAGVTDPAVQFTFEGDIAATPTQRFTLRTNDGRSGVIELIPGPAFNLLEVNFQADPRANKIRGGNFILVKK
jgi:hypothetical protein